MHNAHVDFARIELEDSKKLRIQAVERWTSHISRLDVAVGFDLYALLDMWRVLDRVGGQAWWACRPYKDQLVRMDASDPSAIHAVSFVATFFGHNQKFGELQGVLWRILKSCDDHGGASPEVQMAALYYTRRSLLAQGRYRESGDCKRRLGELVGPSFQLQVPNCGASFVHTRTTFHAYGVGAKVAGSLKDAEEWF